MAVFVGFVLTQNNVDLVQTCWFSPLRAPLSANLQFYLCFCSPDLSIFRVCLCCPAWCHDSAGLLGWLNVDVSGVDRSIVALLSFSNLTIRRGPSADVSMNLTTVKISILSNVLTAKTGSTKKRFHTENNDSITVNIYSEMFLLMWAKTGGLLPPIRLLDTKITIVMSEWTSERLIPSLNTSCSTQLLQDI